MPQYFTVSTPAEVCISPVPEYHMTILELQEAAHSLHLTQETAIFHITTWSSLALTFRPIERSMELLSRKLILAALQL